VYYIPDKNTLPKFLKTIVKKGDILITMGAGDIWKYGEEFLKQQSHVSVAGKNERTKK